MPRETNNNGESNIPFTIHLEGRGKDLLAFEKEYVSPIISIANQIEVKMGEIISFYYCNNTEMAIEMQSNILPNTNYGSKVAVLMKILKEHPSILVRSIKIWKQHWIEDQNNATEDEIVNKLREQLKSIRKTRNNITHRIIDLDETHYKKDDYIQLIYCYGDPSPKKYSKKDLLNMYQKHFEIFGVLILLLNKISAND